jgi:hypothetical protein
MEGSYMTRQEIFDQIKQAFGSTITFHEDMPDAVLERSWTELSWLFTHGALSARDEALISFGAASAIHCE